jgi:hypothetical protein
MAIKSLLSPLSSVHTCSLAESKIGEKIINHVKSMKETKQWKDSDGQFIPNPLTYINQARWEDGKKVKNVWEGGI